MKHQLIADAGATKIDWACLSPDGAVRRFQTAGLNAILASDHELAMVFNSVSRLLSGTEIECVHYYGAGCASPSLCTHIRNALVKAIGIDHVFVASDLLAAARALLGHSQGIACILGTGSNSCLYDGRDITMNIPPMGFILGDEGSGAVLGRRLLADIAKTIAPQHIRDEFMEWQGLNLSDILDHVYRLAGPNRFLASMVPFISRNISDPYMHRLVQEEFLSFLNRNVMRYPGACEVPVNFTGSIAAVFENILREAAGMANLSVGRIMAAPMPGLITYHTDHTD